jgi:predicted thioesterase
MDDIIGWTAFHVTGRCIAWSGFTAQINVSLKRPIAVGSYLKIVGKVVRCEGRKVWVDASLLDVQEDDDESIHCMAEGLVILKRGH